MRLYLTYVRCVRARAHNPPDNHIFETIITRLRLLLLCYECYVFFFTANNNINSLLRLVRRVVARRVRAMVTSVIVTDERERAQTWPTQWENVSALRETLICSVLRDVQLL